MFLALIISVTISTLPSSPLPNVCLTTDDLEIRQSCTIVVPPGTVIEDKNGNGVIQIAASDIHVRFAEGAVLRGSPSNRPPDEYRGYGIRLNGHSNVTIQNARISGFWGVLWATNANGLTIDAVDGSDNRRAHLKSTPASEDGGDWLFPHKNDRNEWLNNYAAAFYIEDSNDITVRNCRVRHGQNGLCLDRVNRSKIYDNDFSFNSGWGIALWRCNRNTIARNACDFCVRGYSHGVYNRGQDSAGILMFEQCSDNVIAENSATHGGDGFFGFAGHEALGETGEHSADWYHRRGNNRNLLIGNDFSYAPAHGIEMTFSFGNTFYDNRLVENAICGVWGGYSQDTLIAQNQLAANGEMAYGLERGGINIEHGKGNRIISNTFEKNKCGVHLWWDPDGDFARKPWAKANGTESKGNVISANRFAGNKVAFHFRGPSEVTLAANTFVDARQEIVKEADTTIREVSDLIQNAAEPPAYTAYGQTRPVGARRHLRGRQNIVMTEWGPWDHESPLIREVQDDGDSVRYDLHKLPAEAQITIEGRHVTGRLAYPGSRTDKATYTVSTDQPGVHPYRIQARAEKWRQDIHGALISATWDVTFFKWTQETDPREDLEAWRQLAQGKTAVRGEARELRFPYGWGGPSEQKISRTIADAKLGGDRFGMIARTKLPLSAGAWRFKTLSDDGVRVTVDGKPIIENWTWHGPTPNTGTLNLTEDRTVEIVVEHFEIDGYAVLEVDISPQNAAMLK